MIMNSVPQCSLPCATRCARKFRCARVAIACYHYKGHHHHHHLQVTHLSQHHSLMRINIRHNNKNCTQRYCHFYYYKRQTFFVPTWCVFSSLAFWISSRSLSNNYFCLASFSTRTFASLTRVSASCIYCCLRCFDLAALCAEIKLDVNGFDCRMLRWQLVKNKKKWKYKL